ncbi:hypothetical protein LTR47_005087 [Exophiala xenobiotica]|nr:hypothetical protein LTR47_005087 [Exophiala xenobiotica]KAK5246364.1 hypothetical protein LTS06_008312 [Exophiala xenobiotica]KAK5326647.1 hypothetical protein LTR93_003510 [Exophiala xenobiotica]KAK5353338.1 hypothetical protein LTR61_003296 [Exophiala xenobiotica]KAK5380119.1 Histone-lysine N-methyltransferase setd2 [Exophiala xenobiotica]
MAPRSSARLRAKITKDHDESVHKQGPQEGRGHRIAKPTARYTSYKKSLSSSGKAETNSTLADSVNSFMIRLYAEILAAAVGPINDKERSEIRGLVRKARTLRFLDLCTKEDADNLKNILKDSQPSEIRGEKVVRRAINDLQVSHPERLVGFCHSPNLVLLCICAHSQTFRAAIARDNAESKAEKQPRWGDILSKIKKCASSLELFAKTRGLEWRKELDAINSDWDSLLTSCFQGSQHINGINHKNFGIGPEDLREIHHPTDETPHHWVLPRSKEGAKRGQFEYKFNTGLSKQKFYGRKVPGKLNGSRRPKIGTRQVAEQVNVDQSMVLDTYDWSYLPDQAQGDPRFAGYKGRCCSACGKEDACSCTLTDLCSEKGGVANPLLELIATEKTGVGVRVLQEFKRKDFVGEYIGEIYPLQVPGRYGEKEGEMYVFPRPVYQEGDLEPRKRRGKGKKRGPKEKDDNEKKEFIIDPAIYGNWTRYINHSCEPNALYEMVNLGQRQAIVIRTLRDVGFGEELTVDYGRNYFRNMGFGCICGSEHCLYSKRE